MRQVGNIYIKRKEHEPCEGEPTETVQEYHVKAIEAKATSVFYFG